MKPLNDTELKRLHRSWRKQSKTRMALLLDHVQGPFNIGAILRTGAAMHVDHIYGVAIDTSWTDAKVQKTAMGTHRFVNCSSFESASEAIEQAKADGYRLVGLELAQDATPLWELDLSGDVCIVIGHEDRGVSPAVLKECSTTGYVPQFGRVGSLNVATAASIACYEVRRQSVGG